MIIAGELSSATTTTATITSLGGEEAILVYGEKSLEVELKKGEEIEVDGELEFEENTRT